MKENTNQKGNTLSREEFDLMMRDIVKSLVNEHPEVFKKHPEPWEPTQAEKEEEARWVNEMFDK
jgi:hypothetical protein